VQVHVSRLRRALGDAACLVTAAGGYLLRVGPDELDLDRFEGRVAEGRAALDTGDGERAARLLREALALWRGPPLAELAAMPFAAAAVARLAEQRLAAIELRVAADLPTG
jgi:DNA-binding SARP family transcriptional activator